MSTTTAVSARPSFSARLLLAGLVAGIVMAMWTMILEALLPGGAGFWAAPVYIGATVLRGLQSVPTPVLFDLGGVLLGLMGHMMNSIIFGLIFAFLIAPRVHSLGGQVIAGIVYSVAIFLVMWFVIAPAVDPAILHLNTLGFLVGHMMFGAALGGLNHRLTHTA